MRKFYRRYLGSQKSRTKSYLLNSNKRNKTKNQLRTTIDNLKRSYWRRVKNANLIELFNLNILSSKRIKFKEFPILLVLVIYECIQLSFRNKLPYLVFLIIFLQSIVYLKNTTDLFTGYLEFVHFKSTPILSIDSLSNSKFLSSQFFNLILFNCLIHLTDLHLYISMINFLWKGQLEIIFGKIKFAIILITFLLLVNLIFLSINFLAYFCTLNEYFLKNQICGFTPITFAFKVCYINYEKEFRLKTNRNLSLSQEQIRTESEENLIKEIILESCVVQTPIWFELLCFLLFLPKITLLNHLSGLLVGILFIRTKFLKKFIDNLVFYLEELFNLDQSTDHNKASPFKQNRIDSPSLGKILINNKVQLCLDQLRLKKTYYFE